MRVGTRDVWDAGPQTRPGGLHSALAPAPWRRLGVPVMIAAGPSAERGGAAGTRRGQSLGQSPARRGPEDSSSSASVFGVQHESRERPPGSGPGALPRVSWPTMAPSRHQAWAACTGVRPTGAPSPPGGAGHRQDSSPACQPRGEPGWPLPELPIWPQPPWRALLQVTRGSD